MPEEPRAATSGSMFALIAQGEKRLALGEQVYDYRAGQYLVACVDLPVTGHFVGVRKNAPALGFGLVLNPATIASLLLETHDQGRPAPALGVATATPELLDAVIRLVRLLDEPADQPVLAPMIEREILWRLLNGPMGASVRQAGMSDSSLTHVSRAVRWITSNYEKSFLVEDLADQVGLSPSAFHRAFRAVTTFTPIQFQKQLRLQQSRLLLMRGSDDVASVAHSVGYDSATQFNREYRRQFGRPPGQDAALLRDGDRKAGDPGPPRRKSPA